MLTWNEIGKWGRRASDVGATMPSAPRRDLLLEAAIAHEQVDVLYQPLIDPESGRISGAEALARSPVVADAEMLFARATAGGLDERLSRLIQRKALRSAAVWEGPLKSLGLSINILPADISRDGYDDWLLDEIEQAGIDPSRVTLEITESALLAERQQVADRLTRLREAGVRIAVDDFGTGYASLAYLTSLPLDAIKIDRGLVADIVGGERDRIVVRAMIHLARELDLTVVVEGVETAGQLALLAEWGCDLYQGFLGAGALTHEELTRFVTAANAELV
ncbi:MAG: EAL domain-containing protein [Sphingomicrobium sp.]|jgi:EAL domain-containing protein (putative c-di-GMP-specific phosphodiesterase class I)